MSPAITAWQPGRAACTPSPHPKPKTPNPKPLNPTTSQQPGVPGCMLPGNGHVEEPLDSHRTWEQRAGSLGTLLRRRVIWVPSRKVMVSMRSVTRPGMLRGTSTCLRMPCSPAPGQPPCTRQTGHASSDTSTRARVSNAAEQRTCTRPALWNSGAGVQGLGLSGTLEGRPPASHLAPG